MVEGEKQGGAPAHAVAHEVHPFEAQVVEQRGEVVNEILNPVGARRLGGVAVAPVVMAHHLEALREAAGGGVPDVVAGRKTVRQYNRGALAFDPVAEVHSVDGGGGQRSLSRGCGRGGTSERSGRVERSLGHLCASWDSRGNAVS